MPQGTGLDIEILRPADVTADRVAHWQALQGADITLDSPFLSPGWARAVDQAQGAGTRNVRVAVIRQDGRDLGYFPVRIGPVTAMPAGAPMCDYQGLVAEPGVEISPRDLVRALGVQRYDFSHMLEDQPVFAPFARGHDFSHVVSVPEGYGAFEAERKAAGTSVLKDCDKKRRKAEREHEQVLFTAYSRVDADLDQLIAWKRAQLLATGQTDLFETDWTLRLIRALFESRDPDFGATLFTLRIGQKLAAVHLHLRGRKTIHGWLIAHDPEFERYSPGILLFQDILRWMDTTPFERLDLGPGDYRFKRELANHRQGVSFGFIGTASPAAFIRGAAYGLAAAAESLPLGRASALPGKALRRIDILRGLR